MKRQTVVSSQADASCEQQRVHLDRDARKDAAKPHEAAISGHLVLAIVVGDNVDLVRVPLDGDVLEAELGSIVASEEGGRGRLTADLILRRGALEIEAAMLSSVTSSYAGAGRQQPLTIERGRTTHLKSPDGAHVDVHRDVHLALAVHAGDDRGDLREATR